MENFAEKLNEAQKIAKSWRPGANLVLSSGQFFDPNPE